MVLELEPEHISKTSLTDLVVTKWMGVLGKLQVAQDPGLLLPGCEAELPLVDNMFTIQKDKPASPGDAGHFGQMHPHLTREVRVSFAELGHQSVSEERTEPFSMDEHNQLL